MYEEFEEYLSGFFSGDYWYDEGVIIATEMLEEFDDSDWEKLLSKILSKPTNWQIRFAYCVESDINDEAILKSLILLSNIENNELFETCIDSLRCIINSNNVRIIANNKTILEQIEKILPKCNSITQKIIKDFLIKLSNLKNNLS